MITLFKTALLRAPRLVLIADYPPFRRNTFFPTSLLQTIAPLIIQGQQSDYSAVKHTVDLFDGDRLVIHDDQPKKWITGDRIAILSVSYTHLTLPTIYSV